jgi:hypothetical protein
MRPPKGKVWPPSFEVMNRLCCPITMFRPSGETAISSSPKFPWMTRCVNPGAGASMDAAGSGAAASASNEGARGDGPSAAPRRSRSTSSSPCPGSALVVHCRLRPIASASSMSAWLASEGRAPSRRTSKRPHATAVVMLTIRVSVNCGPWLGCGRRRGHRPHPRAWAPCMTRPGQRWGAAGALNGARRPPSGAVPGARSPPRRRSLSPGARRPPRRPRPPRPWGVGPLGGWACAIFPQTVPGATPAQGSGAMVAVRCPRASSVRGCRPCAPPLQRAGRGIPRRLSASSRSLGRLRNIHLFVLRFRALNLQEISHKMDFLGKAPCGRGLG